MSKELIIHVPWGGFGDHLFHSPIARLAKTQYRYDKVYVSRNSKFNSPQVKKLVWELNPYFDGFEKTSDWHVSFGAVPDDMNICDMTATMYGVPDKEQSFIEPEIYYDPKYIPELREAVIFEINHSNTRGIPTRNQIESYFLRNGIKRTHQTKNVYNSFQIDLLPILKVRDLFHLCDVIFSCKEFYCLITGAATLAAALSKPTTVLYVDGVLPMFLHSKLHTYENLDTIEGNRHAGNQ